MLTAEDLLKKKAKSLSRKKYREPDKRLRAELKRLKTKSI